MNKLIVTVDGTVSEIPCAKVFPSLKPLPTVRFTFETVEHVCQVGDFGCVFLGQALRRKMGMVGLSSEGAIAV